MKNSDSGGLLTKEIEDVSKELLEPDAEKLIESVAKINIPDSVPVLGSAMLAINAFRFVHDKLVLERIKKLRETMLSSEDSQRLYSNMKKKDKVRLTNLLVSEVDQQTNLLQAEALGYLTEAYILKKIEYDNFVGLAAELKRLNPIVFGGQNRKKLFQEANGMIYGPYDLLPNTFTSDHSLLNAGTVIDPSKKYLTDLGQWFYYLVYKRMVTE